MSVEIAVIPVAGRGTRLLPLTKSLPKEMLPVGRKPVIQHVVDELSEAGLHSIHLVTSREKSVIEDHFDHNPNLIESLRRTGKESHLSSVLSLTQNSRISWTRQSAPLGLGHAVLSAADFVGNRSFFVALGDALIVNPHQKDTPSLAMRMLNTFTDHSADAVIAFGAVAPDQVSRYGIADPGKPMESSHGAFEVRALVEKPSIGDAPSQLAITARYIFSPRIFDYLRTTSPGHDNEIQLTDAIQALLKDGGRVLGVSLTTDETRFDVGNLESYYDAVCHALYSDPELAPILAAFK